LTSDGAHLPFFVYGTLLPGEANYPLWREAIAAMTPAALPGARLYDLGYFPMAVEMPQEGPQGEVIGLVVYPKPEYYASAVALLDLVEGFDPDAMGQGAYRRSRRVVRLANGEPIVAWVYLGHPRYVAGLEPLTSHWKARCDPLQKVATSESGLHLAVRGEMLA
jgi:gamma-glutamylcyclotransferase (GGCT)/AIG2-like uncharacterized protein YtfP